MVFSVRSMPRFYKQEALLDSQCEENLSVKISCSSRVVESWLVSQKWLWLRQGGNSGTQEAECPLLEADIIENL
jgi:hypothetical protein